VTTQSPLRQADELSASSRQVPIRLFTQSATSNDRVARVGSAPASMLVFWGFALITVVFSHYQISGRLNLPYKALTILVCLLAPLTPGFLSLFGKRQILYLLAFEAVLILGCLVGYTGSPSDLIRVGSQPVVLLRVFPFLLCGYTLALHPRFERLFLALLLAAFALLTLPDAILLYRGTTSGMVRERFLIEAYDQASAQALVSAMVNVSVLGLLLALAGVRLYDSRRTLIRFVVAVPQAILASLSVTAGFTAAFVLLAWCTVVGILLAPARTLRFRFLLLITVGIVAPAGLYALQLVAGQTGGSLAKISRRIEGLRKVITGQDGNDVNETTSGRYSLAALSMASFARSPLIGLGRGRAGSEKGGDTETIGGHSFLLDSLGQRGLLGTLPLIMWLVSLARVAWQCMQRERSWRASAGLTFVLTWVVAITINPYFLGYLALNSVVFLWFGFVLGDGQRVALGKSVASIAPRFAVRSIRAAG
jgi:O-antigen ligase